MVADDDSLLAGAAAATVATVAVVVVASVVVVVASLSVVLSVGCPIGLTGPMVVDDVVVAVVDDDAVVVVAEGVFAMVDENTASFWGAVGGAPEVLASVFLAVSCMA